MDPLETRSMPRGLWQHVPEAIVRLDSQARDYLAGLPLDQSPWYQIRWITEEPRGIATGIALIALGAWFAFRGERKPSALLFRLMVLVPFFGLSDLAATGFKLLIGRLKPHVTFYNPHVTPALSCPSSHAFNTAFALSLVWFALEPSSRQRHRKTFFIAAGLVAGVGLTRVLFGQHYPLDVLTGGFLGTAFGRIASPLYRKVVSLRTVRS